MASEPFYRTSFSKHLHALARSNYFVRKLDADDAHFIDHIREHGALPGREAATFDFVSRPSVLLSELDYWQARWDIERGIDRRRPEKKVRNADTHRLIQRRITRQERAEEAEVLKAEQAEWRKKQEKLRAEREKQILKTMIADVEWEAAEKARVKDADEIDQRIVNQATHDVAQRKSWREQKVCEADYYREPTFMDQLQRSTQRERAKLEGEYREAVEVARKKAIEAEKAAKAAKAKELAEYDARRKVAAEAEKAESKAQAETRKAARQKQAEAAYGMFTRTEVKRKLVEVIYRSGQTSWNLDNLCNAIGHHDQKFVVECLRELEREGKWTLFDHRADQRRAA